MSDLSDYLPLRVMRFVNGSGDTDVDEIVLGEVVSFDDEITEVAFNIGRKRYYIGIRHSDLPMLTPPPENPNK